MDHPEVGMQMIKKFIRDESGSVLPIFVICLGAILAAAGAAVDFSRASASRTAMQGALDAAALILAKEASTLTPAQLAQKAQSYFEVNFHSAQAKNIVVMPTFSNVGGINKISLQ